MVAIQIKQHKRFVSYGTHLNPPLTFRTSFMRGTLYAIQKEGGFYEK